MKAFNYTLKVSNDFETLNHGISKYSIKNRFRLKLALLLQLTLLTQLVAAQSYINASPAAPFDGVSYGDIAFEDVNGDSFEDILITGRNSNGIAKLYLNNGMGNFNLMMGTPFLGVDFSSIAFADVNGDGHKDVLITGRGGPTFMPTSNLYTNNGSGNFSLVSGTPFVGVEYGSVAFSDVNGDGYQDVLITGEDSASNGVAKLYINDSLGNFSERMNTPFTGVTESSVAFSDVNGDGYQDVLITGLDSSSVPISKLYINDSLGNFNLLTNTPFTGVYFSSVAFSDVDSDGIEDVLITGADSSFIRTSKLYINNGRGNFIEKSNVPFLGVAFGSVNFSDVNSDGYPDALITGSDSLLSPSTKLYTNDGFGNFTEVLNTPFDNVVISSAAFSDVNNDGKEDVVISGETNSFTLISKMYLNQGVVNSVDDLTIDSGIDFTLYPNPTTSDIVNLSFETLETGLADITIHDFRGSLVLHQQKIIGRGKQHIVIDISNIASGSYLIKLSNNQKSTVNKLMIR